MVAIVLVVAMRCDAREARWCRRGRGQLFVVLWSWGNISGWRPQDLRYPHANNRRSLVPASSINMALFADATLDAKDSDFDHGYCIQEKKSPTIGVGKG